MATVQFGVNCFIKKIRLYLRFGPKRRWWPQTSSTVSLNQVLL